jgi:hypothetical protein
MSVPLRYLPCHNADRETPDDDQAKANNTIATPSVLATGNHIFIGPSCLQRKPPFLKTDGKVQLTNTHHVPHSNRLCTNRLPQLVISGLLEGASQLDWHCHFRNYDQPTKQLLHLCLISVRQIRCVCCVCLSLVLMERVSMCPSVGPPSGHTVKVFTTTLHLLLDSPSYRCSVWLMMQHPTHAVQFNATIQT